MKFAARPARKMADFHGIKTVAPEMFAFFDIVTKAARSGSTVLIRGETGTGKELVARLLHELGPRAGKPFRALNCATLTPELLASELFGHVRGAFTGAVSDRRGLFELAHRGTVFLDEIAEIPVEIQARLLRVLQERSFTPVGGTQARKIDVRVISATHQALRDYVARGRFRADLMYRVRVVPIFLPRLAQRTGDIEALTWHFVDHFNRSEQLRTVENISTDVMDALLAYDWPGNVRELRNVVEYAFVVGEGPVMSLDEVTPEIRGEPPELAHGMTKTEHDMERERLLDALRQTNHRRGEAAKLLGISRTTLWRKLKEHGIS